MSVLFSNTMVVKINKIILYYVQDLIIVMGLLKSARGVSRVKLFALGFLCLLSSGFTDFALLSSGRASHAY